jgi:hypothetical protein
MYFSSVLHRNAALPNIIKYNIGSGLRSQLSTLNLPFIEQTIELKTTYFYEHCQLAVSLRTVCLQKTGKKHDVEVFLRARHVSVYSPSPYSM